MSLFCQHCHPAPHSKREGRKRGEDVLSFELVRQDEICFSQQTLVLWHFIFWDVQFPVVAHYRVEHCLHVSC